VGRTLNRVAGVVSAAALATFAAAPAALAQDETSTSPTETTTSTSETSTSSSPSSTTSAAPTTVPSSTSGIATSDPGRPDVKTTDKRIAPKAAPEIKGDTQEPPKDGEEPQQDNVGQGFVGLGGEGVLVIACAAGAPGEVAAQYLSVTGGPEQDGANGLLWNYTVRVTTLPAGTTTGKFSWTCAGVEGNGTVEFQQEEPPTSTSPSPSTSTSASPSSTAPVTTATSATTATTTTTASGNAAPKAQVKVAPKGGVETGFGGTAR
jgi:cytoskeletal protein RodZ